MGEPYMHIGEVATLTALSLRTIRHYEEVGLVVPSGRSQGGFRLYVQADVDRLRLIRNMKRLFSLEEMRDMLEVSDALAALTEDQEEERARLLDRLDMYRQAALAQIDALREQVAQGEALASDLANTLARRGRQDH